MGFLDTNCTVAPQQAQSDAGVAGTGVRFHEKNTY